MTCSWSSQIGPRRQNRATTAAAHAPAAVKILQRAVKTADHHETIAFARFLSTVTLTENVEKKPCLTRDGSWWCLRLQGLARVALLLHSQEGHRANAVNICIGMTVTVSTRGTGSRRNPGPMKRWPSTGNHDLIRSRPGSLKTGPGPGLKHSPRCQRRSKGWAAQRPRIATAYTTNAKRREGREAWGVKRSRGATSKGAFVASPVSALGLHPMWPARASTPADPCR